MTDKRLEYLFERYLNKTNTDVEFLELLEVISAGKYHKELEDLTDEYWDKHEVLDRLADEKADQIFTSIVNHPDDNYIRQFKKTGKTKFAYLAAAAVLLFVSLGLLFYNMKTKAVNMVMLQVKAGNNHQLIRLADGSTVVLNHNSSLKYPKVFNSRREVTLIGEGYFDIKHDTDHPFIVHTGNLITTVLGTAFNIKAYDQEKNITVTVTRGKVSVSNADKVLGVITPNQQLSFNKDHENAMQVSVNSAKTVEWQSKDLFFEDLTMQEAVTELEQRFNTKITFSNDAVKKCRFTGTFLHGEKLKDILQVICDFNNATYITSDDGQIVINGPGCSP